MRKGKVFEIKVASSASFYSYLALSGIDFKTKEKSDVIIFTCDMTDAEFGGSSPVLQQAGGRTEIQRVCRKIQKTA